MPREYSTHVKVHIENALKRPERAAATKERIRDLIRQETPHPYSKTYVWKAIGDLVQEGKLLKHRSGRRYYYAYKHT